jgi:mRNA deadenylase 3'-5' endonuclease subunit Ccr4
LSLDAERRAVLAVSAWCGIAADVAAFEELDEARYAATWEPLWKSSGYSSIFCKKHGSDHLDGVCLAWRSALFDCVSSERWTLRDRDTQVAIAALLKVKDEQKYGNRRLLVVATHLKAKHGGEQVRLEQAAFLTAKIAAMLRAAAAAPDAANAHFGIVFAGDLNDVPSSPALRFLQCGHYRDPPALELPDDAAHAAQRAKESGAVRVHQHSMQLYSCYDRHFAQHSDLFTTTKERDCVNHRCIDYILYSSATLRCAALLDIPNQKQLLPHLLPALNYPSDHLAIAAQLAFRD